MFYDDLSVYPAFRGVDFAEEEGERIADYLGPKNKNLIMQNHGLLTAGGTVAEAAAFFYRSRKTVSDTFACGGISCTQIYLPQHG